MKTATKALTATASTGSVVGGGYTIYHFSSAENVSSEEEQDSSFAELKDDAVSSKVLKEEEDNISNETVEDTSEKNLETQKTSNPKEIEPKVTQKRNQGKQQTTDPYKEATKNLFLFSTKDLENNKYKDKILGITKKTHLPLLVKADVEDNKKWWEWSYNEKFSKLKNQTTLNPLFSSINKGYSDNENDLKALNQSCNKAYNEDKLEYGFNPENYLLENIGFFCTKDKDKKDISEPEPTVFGTLHKTSTSFQDGLLGINKNKDLLVNVRNENNNNELWWNWSYEKKVKNKEGLTDFFSKVDSGFDADVNKGLNGACNKIYSEKLKNIRNHNHRFKLLNEIKSFCAINNKQDLVLMFENEPVNPETFLLTKGQTLNNEYKDKILNVTKQENLKKIVKNVEANEDWWEWAYQYKFLANKTKLKTNTHFKNLTLGYYKDNNQSLSKACHDAYNKKHSDYSKLIDDISWLCTTGNGFVDVREPKSVVFSSDTNTVVYKNGLLGIPENKNNLSRILSINYDDYLTELWWEWVYETRFPQSDKDRQALSSVFKSVSSEYGGDTDYDALNQACKISYKKPLSEFQGDGEKLKLLQDVQKFCTIDPTKDLALK